MSKLQRILIYDEMYTVTDIYGKESKRRDSPFVKVTNKKGKYCGLLCIVVDLSCQSRVPTVMESQGKSWKKFVVMESHGK